MAERAIRIAIDGPASSGKGTVARTVAQALGFAYVDTGAMYRSVAYLAKEQGIALDDSDALASLTDSLVFAFEWVDDQLAIIVDGRDLTASIRQEQVGRGASNVAVLPAVRTALLGRQQALAVAGGVVMEGRDIATVVLPDAELKVYLDATVEERARRRCLELEGRGTPVPYDQLFEELKARDAQDRGREVAPLIRHPDALYIDCTTLTPDEVTNRILAHAGAIS